MKLLNYFVVLIFIVIILCTSIESKGGRGGGRGGFSRSGGSRRSGSSGGGWFSWGSSSSSRRSSSSVVTSRPRTNYGKDYYSSRRSSSSVVTGRPRPHNYASKVTTPRSYVQSTRRSTYYGGSGYVSRTNRYGNRRNSTQQYGPPGYYQPLYYNSYGHNSGITPVLAGLGGSALGMYLGYQMASMSNSYNSLYHTGYDYPRYSVVHHYHHGDKPIAQNAEIKENIIATCNNITFCVPNTQPLCLTNGTVYCLTPINNVNICNINSTEVQCVKTTLAAPCLNNVTNNCTDNSVTNINIGIPCLTNIFTFTNFSTGVLQIHKKEEATLNSSATSSNSLANVDSTISGNGIRNEFCVTVIANPLEPPKNLTNAEFIEQMQYDETSRKEMYSKFETILSNLLRV